MSFPTVEFPIDDKAKGLQMNWDIIQGKWEQAKGSVKKTWGELTDDDLTQINGERERLAGKLQEKYGWTKEEVEKRVDDFVKDSDR